MHGGSSVESGFEPGTLWPRSRDLTTWPPRPRPSRDCSNSMIIIPSQNPPAFYSPIKASHSGFSPKQRISMISHHVTFFLVRRICLRASDSQVPK
ncbi:hypothetical protein AVEN_227582-1 [Araneus ventricosus]|uniref:Uncharacterized protein n=1 Tax=Araneus ventricosus TaxID=182803 RepID=A0A4Y2RSI4_ARAVE|nr:hypothetical protein AVEN_227582-1 [Araneus ventricosus]